jgi:hypothetical protein
LADSSLAGSRAATPEHRGCGRERRGRAYRGRGSGSFLVQRRSTRRNDCDGGVLRQRTRSSGRWRRRGSGGLTRYWGGSLALLLCALLGSAPSAADARSTALPDSTPSAADARSTALPDSTPSAADARSTALLLFVPGTPTAVESELASLHSFSTGLLSATQGSYTTAQLLLDLTQGARVSYSSYSPQHPPVLSLVGRQVLPWSKVLARAHGAPQILEPGLLAASIPGGAAYAGIVGEDHEDGVAGANHTGTMTTVSLGGAATLSARLARLYSQRSLVIADLPAGPAGYADLRALSATRPPGQLLIVLPRVGPAPGHELLWVGLAGLGGGHTLTSQTTNQRGLVSTVDLAPTVLEHLGLGVPSAMRGRPIVLDGSFDGPHLRSLRARLLVVYPRRLPALACLLGVWALLALVASLLPHDARARRRARAWVIRVGALALLWTPVAELLPAALEPTRGVEYALLVLLCFSFGALTDRLLPWPRAPLAPAVVAVVALTADALAGTQLLVRSLLGPDPALGVRFYGIGNELKSCLAVLVFAAVAAALYPLARGSAKQGAATGDRVSSEILAPASPSSRELHGAAVTMALAGIALAIVEGSARIGAGVGGVILVSAGTAVATVLLLPGALTRRRALVVLISPVVALVALAALDLLTAHGGGHYTGSVLHARSAGDIRDIIVRRYGAAWDELKHGAMPLATALALVAAFVGVRRRERLLAPVDGDRVWLAALAGGLTAGIVGALSEDSGPVLLVVAVFALACLLGYLWSAPPAPLTPPRTPHTRRAARSRARTPPGALSR